MVILAGTKNLWKIMLTVSRLRELKETVRTHPRQRKTDMDIRNVDLETS